MITGTTLVGWTGGSTMLAILATVAFVIGLILRVVGAGSGHAADPWVWLFGGLTLWAAHAVSPYTPWRRSAPGPRV
jgi:hypothetical protein